MMATDGNIPESVRDSRWEADFQPNPSYPSHIVNTQHSGRRFIRQEVWIRENRLGHGGFGVVWLERAHSANQFSVALRAVKELRLGRGDDRRRKCLRELEALVKFSQKKFVDSFVEFYGWFESKDALFIATEYCRYGDLKRFVKDNGSIPEPQVQVITDQILQGIIFMHDNDFAHRDLKPTNILIKKRPSHLDRGWHVKICDMGLSKRVGTEATSTTVKGTPGFIAPERIPGIGSNPAMVDPFPCDMWCLGEISFFLLTSGTTFENSLELQQYVNRTVRFPQKRLDGVGASASATNFIRLLMAVQPSERLSANEADSHSWMKTLDDAPDLQPPTSYDQPLNHSLSSGPSLRRPDEIYTGMARVSTEQTTLPHVKDMQPPGGTQESATIPSASWNSSTMAHVQFPSPETLHLPVKDPQVRTTERAWSNLTNTAEIQEPLASGYESASIIPGSLYKDNSSTIQYFRTDSTQIETPEEAGGNTAYDVEDRWNSDDSNSSLDSTILASRVNHNDRTRKYDDMMRYAIRYINESRGSDLPSLARFLRNRNGDSPRQGISERDEAVIQSGIDGTPSVSEVDFVNEPQHDGFNDNIWRKRAPSPSVAKGGLFDIHEEESELSSSFVDRAPFLDEEDVFLSDSQKLGASVGCHPPKRMKPSASSYGGRVGEGKARESDSALPPSTREMQKPGKRASVSNYRHPTVEDAGDSDRELDSPSPSSIRGTRKSGRGVSVTNYKQPTVEDAEDSE
ncbi:kinase-like domain-containing protein [Ustulina deusta]|nr:kinase-like domain-containing protein [Ustulina deusta]